MQYDRADHQIRVTRMDTSSTTYVEELEPGAWYALLVERAQAYYEALQTLEAASEAYEDAARVKPGAPSLVKDGAEQVNWLRLVDDANIATANALAAREAAQQYVEGLRTELRYLADTRDYQPGQQPRFLVTVNGLPHVLLIHSTGAVELVQFDPNQPLPALQ